MSLVPVEDIIDAELVDPEDELDALASDIREQCQRVKSAAGEAFDAQLAIGADLSAARQLLVSDQAFGAWFRDKGFPFNRQWGHVLRTAAEHGPEIQEAVASQLATGKSPNLEKAVKQVKAKHGDGRSARPALAPVSPDLAETEVVPDVFSAIVIDPPWRYDNVATRGAAEDHYPTMSLDELAALELPAADQSHLYLWVTNGFLREGFDLMETWGFTYKTILTWCKPQIGMGNYFRNSTEHVLFGIRGSHPTLANNVPTWFVADRTRHSAKPESFYDLVEKSSPGPWLEMFARRRRFGWHVWGNEA